MNINLNDDVLDFLESHASFGSEFNDIEESFYQYILYRRENSEKVAWRKTINYTGLSLEPSEVADYIEEEMIPKCSNFELSVEIADFVEELNNL